MGSERIGRRVASDLQGARTWRVIQVAVRNQNMGDVLTLKTPDQRVEMCWIIGSGIDDSDGFGPDDVGARAVISEGAWVTGG